jgi:hypothetical protein
MPLERQKRSGLRVIPVSEPTGGTLDELFGPPGGRPGELREPLPFAVSASFLQAARAAGVSSSLAATVTAERWLVGRELGGERAQLLACLDARAVSVRSELALSAVNAGYARLLLAALHGQHVPPCDGDAVLVVASRLADRLRAAEGVELAAQALRPALTWELAAVRAGRTMTEWALAEVLARRYSPAAERQSPAAASAAR